MEIERRVKLAVLGLIVVGVLTMVYQLVQRNEPLPGKFAKVEIIEPEAKSGGVGDSSALAGSGKSSQSDGEGQPVTGDSLSSVGPVVHVAGVVRNPGVYTLEPGGRVIDALKLAGGAKPGADLDSINLAARPSDGEQIYISRKGALPPMANSEAAEPPSLMTPTSAVSPERLRTASDKASVPRGKVNINKAGAAQLDTLPGVGPATAQKIMAYRKASGGFMRPEDIMNVKGIGEKKYADMKAYISVR
ncbi:MAG: helix-hairpin-helix domain-containing protein [Armatimonadota bacterium]